jgi:hypothetical protein
MKASVDRAVIKKELTLLAEEASLLHAGVAAVTGTFRSSHDFGPTA